MNTRRGETKADLIIDHELVTVYGSASFTPARTSGAPEDCYEASSEIIIKRAEWLERMPEDYYGDDGVPFTDDEINCHVNKLMDALWESFITA